MRTSSYVLFGGGLIILPNRSFARFILMMYIMFCLVIRTAYEGQEYKLMLQVCQEKLWKFKVQKAFLRIKSFLKEIRPKDVQTIEELVAKGYKLFGENSTVDYLKQMDFGSRFDQWLDESEVFHFKIFRVQPFPDLFGRGQGSSDSEYFENTIKDKLLNLTRDGSKRGFVTDSDTVEFFSPKRQSFTTLAQKILTDHLGFNFELHNFMFRFFNKKVGQLVEGGIASYIFKNTTKVRNEDVAEPEVLTMNHLGVWFRILFAFLLVAICCFAVEIGVLFYRFYFVWFYLKIHWNCQWWITIIDRFDQIWSVFDWISFWIIFFIVFVSLFMYHWSLNHYKIDDKHKCCSDGKFKLKLKKALSFSEPFHNKKVVNFNLKNYCSTNLLHVESLWNENTS